LIDRGLKISPSARALQGGGTWLFAARSTPEKEMALREVGAEVMLLPNANGQVDLAALMQELGKRMINELHVEAGAVLNGALLQAGMVDELLLYVAPSILGDARGMFALPALENMADKYALKFHEITQIGDDVRILARFN